ncbi:MAG: putative 4-hydroxybenzoate polyprenyltransferase [Saprospiraceae bacterium]|nr:putative 4-hydroxybenzoate polyprenyltransferase [Saprospiraceae bacterium]MCB9305830.1 UbiA family prenyltransferase [Lewinellaceae bacterium]MCB9355735.1 UbiA family prenyltransferase [Lewinellaceae bacterium]
MKSFFSLVRFSHTIFAMPFALTGFFIASSQHDVGLSWQKLLLVVLCMVFARNAAMAFNRYLDRDIDAINPRTKLREIPAGVISARTALWFVALNCLLFVAATWFINFLCFLLSPVALAVVLGYSYTKRFTWLCHLVLGLGLSLAPVGAYLAVAGRFDWIPVLYGLAVLFWVAGFDVIYALQDEDFDKSQRLYSMPSFFGKARALRISEWMHLGTAVLMVYAGSRLFAAAPQTGWLLWLGTAIFLAMLVYQHLLVKPNDLSRVNMAFATTNGIASLIFGTLAIADLLT